MKPTTLSVHISHFLNHYLAGQRNLSPNTIKAYRDVFVLLLRFCRDSKGVAVEKLELQQIDVFGGNSNIKLNYLSIPIVINYKLIGSFLSLQAGPPRTRSA